MNFSTTKGLSMSDKPVVHIGENSPEHVAYELMTGILRVEGKINSADRKLILDTYAECLDAVRGARLYTRDN